MNFVEDPKPRKLTPELEQRAIEFHGHDGPFMTIGLRMGITALEMLDVKGWFGLLQIHVSLMESRVVRVVQWEKRT